MADAIVLAGVDKRFGAVQALVDAGVTLKRGRVGAIVGENGAGKSTLAKIIAGVLTRDRGDLIIDGVARGAWSRGQAIAAGVGFVPQSLSFVATLSIVDNTTSCQAGGCGSIDPAHGVRSRRPPPRWRWRWISTLPWSV